MKQCCKLGFTKQLFYRSCYSLPERKSDNSQHDLIASWCPALFLHTISPGLWEPVFIAGLSQEYWFHSNPGAHLWSRRTSSSCSDSKLRWQQRTSAFCTLFSFCSGFHERKAQFVGQKMAVRHAKETPHLDGKGGWTVTRFFFVSVGLTSKALNKSYWLLE